MAIKTFTTGEVLTASDTNTYLANSGLVYIKSQTVGSAVSSVTVTGAFSADYDRFLIIWVGGVSSAVPNMRLTLGSTSTGYYHSGFFANYANTSTGFAGQSNGSSWDAGYATTNNVGISVELQDPFATRTTMMRTQATTTASTGFMNFYAGFLDNTTSYTSFTYTPTTGTLTGGTITVYGYRKA